jgi:hypothetical protein
VEAALEQMAAASVTAIECHRVRPHQPLHAAREVRLRRFDDEMKVIRHQDPGSHAPAEAFNRFAEEFQEEEAVAVGAKDRLPLIAASGDVVGSAGEIESKLSCHDATASLGCRRMPWLLPLVDVS